MEAIKNAVIYCRVSTKEQAEEGGSLKTQEKLCRSYALQNKFHVVRVFVEEGESAKTKDRTKLKLLLEYCTNKKNNVSVVIAYKVDRIARNLDDYRYIKVLLKRYGVEIRSTTEHIEDTPAGRFMENMIANVAQFDNDVRAERSIGGMRDAIREGRYVWGAPFGYTNAVVEGKTNIIQTERASIALKLFLEVAKNEDSVEKVRERLLSEGLEVRPGKKISRAYCFKILRNELYAGWIVKFGERHRGKFDPIVPQEIFDQVQRVLNRKSHRGYTYQSDRAEFPLRRFVKHPTGKKITGAWSKGLYRKYPYYRFVGIPKSDIRSEKLNTLFQDLLSKFEYNKSELEEFKNCFTTVINRSTVGFAAQKEKLKRNILELEFRQNALVDKGIKGVISDELLKSQLTLIDEQLLNVRAELLKYPDVIEDFENIFERVKKLLHNLSSAWECAPIKEKVKLQWFVFPKGITLVNGELRTTEISSVFNTKTLFRQILSSKVPLGGHKIKHPINNQLQKSLAITEENCSELRKELSRLVEILSSESANSLLLPKCPATANC